MDCPVCKNAMITLELDDVEIDFCCDCNGIWLDSGEIELLIADKQQVRKLIDSFKIEKNIIEKLRKCPICLKKMQKISVSQSETPLLIDKCTQNHGLWFDKGELKKIISIGQFDSQKKIQSILNNIFGEQSSGEPKKENN